MNRTKSRTSMDKDAAPRIVGPGGGSRLGNRQENAAQNLAASAKTMPRRR